MPDVTHESYLVAVTHTNTFPAASLIIGFLWLFNAVRFRSDPDLSNRSSVCVTCAPSLPQADVPTKTQEGGEQTEQAAQ